MKGIVERAAAVYWRLRSATGTSGHQRLIYRQRPSSAGQAGEGDPDGLAAAYDTLSPGAGLTDMDRHLRHFR
jgi:hypothetical protein